MGSDLRRILPAVEETFGFSIPDEDAARLDTFDAIYRYTLAHRFRLDRLPCLNSIAFHRIRQAMASVVGTPRERIRPSTPLAAIVGRRRRRTWRTLEQATGYRFPTLCRPGWVTATNAVVAVVAAVAVPMLLGLGLMHGAMLVGAVAALVTFQSMGWLTTPLAWAFRSEFATAGQLAAGVLARNFRAIVAQAATSATEADVWDALCALVADRPKTTAA